MNMPVGYHLWGAMLEYYQNTCQSWPLSCRDKRPFCLQYGM